MNKIYNIKAIYLYLAAFIWVILLGLIINLTGFNTTAIGMILVFLTLVLGTGTLFLRISHLEIQDFWVKFLYVAGFGLSFFFTINFLSIIFGLSLNQLIFAIFFFIIAIFILALLEDRREIYKINLSSLKEKTSGEWAIIGALVVFSFISLICVNAQAENLVGDGAFQLAILNKIVTSGNLSANNLWMIKGVPANIMYGYPVWHIFLGILSKILDINIFTVFIRSLLPIVILVLMSGFALVKVIFKNRFMAYIGFFVLNLYFLCGTYHFLVPVRSPDSLVRWLLFPVLLGLSFHYFYEVEEKKYLHALLIAVFSLLMGLVHFTQLIDYLIILGVFVIVNLIFNRRKEIFVKIGWLFLILAVLVLPYLLIFQFDNLKQLIQSNILAFQKSNSLPKSYREFGIFGLYTLFSLPILGLYLSKYKRFGLLISIPLALIFVSWQALGLQKFFLKYFGVIFTDRAVTDIPTYIFSGFILFLIIWGLSRLLAFGKNLPYLTYAFLILATSIIIFTPFKTVLTGFVDEALLSLNNLAILENFILILTLIIALVVCSYFVFKYLHKDLPALEITNINLFASMIIFAFFILSLPYYQNISKIISSNPNGNIFQAKSWQFVGDTAIIGGQKTIDQVSMWGKGSVFSTSNISVAQNILLYSPAYVFEYPYGVDHFSLKDNIYNPNLTLDKRLTALNDYGIEYIITLNPFEREIFADEPRYFEKIFENQYVYQSQSKEGLVQKPQELVVFRYIK